MTNKTFMNSHALRVMISESLKSAKKKWDSYKVRNDPDFRRAAVKIKRRYNGMLSEYEMDFGHKDYLETVQPRNNDYQWIFEFPNGYGASVIRTPYSYGGDQGKFELAVLKDGECCYDTEITQDVLGYLDESEVEQYLNEIKELPDDKRTSMGCI